jgi:uncharacterized protein YceH (UPF0502 family)/N-acetylglutamate synthase-like GNAT family acetyltransferase
VEPDAVEIRVLGCLIEKQRTTPDAYPLSLNALRLACNQSTNRHPVVAYDEGVIKDALQRTYRRGWTRLASGHGSRAAKYRHLLDEALGLAPDELALLAVLMLRGAQTPGELKQRSERLHGFADLAAVEATLGRLIERGHVERLVRRPGQKEERYRQVVGGAEAEPAGAPASADRARSAADAAPPTAAASAAPATVRRALDGGFELDDDPARLDVAAIHRYLSEESYWASGCSRERVEASIAGSTRVIGLYRDGRQLGFARVISDGVTRAYLADVFVLAEARGRGLGTELVREAVEGGGHDGVPFLLHTADAHALYERFGFERVGERLMERSGRR